MKLDSIKQQWDRALALVAAAVGVVALLLGWIGVSGVALVTQQIPYLVSGAVVGLVAFGAASTLWISADLRDEWAKLDDIHRAITDPAGRSRPRRMTRFGLTERASVDLRQEPAKSGRRG